MKHLFKRAIPILVCALLTSASLAAQFKVTGNVSDASGGPLIGVSILVKGSITGTITDFDGNFDLQVPGSSGTLVFTYTGFATKEVAASPGMAALAIVLEDDIARLSEVVVTGLASGVKRSNSGNAITSINADELTGGTNAQTLDNALYGKIPGVNMTSNGGAPGGGINVQLRGISTLGAGSSQPLYIIDGVYVDNSSIRTGRTQVSGAGGGASGATQDDAANRIADINPDDIERIEVLKGPSAAAIYGTRANAGVIIITTKKGQAGKTKVSLSQDIGFAQGQNFQNFDSWDEAKVNTFFGTGAPAQLAALQAAQAENRVTDWEQYFYGERPVLSNTQLSVSGGTDKTQFFVSAGAQNEGGIIKNTGFQRYSVRANVEHRITDRIRFSLNNNYISSNSDRGFTGNQNNTGGSIGYALAYTPSYVNLFPDANGNYPNNPFFNDNPLAIRDLAVNNQQVDRFITAANLDIDLYTGVSTYLKFKMNGGVDYISGNSQVYFPENLQHQRAEANPGDIMWGRQDNINYNLQGFLILGANLGTVSSTTSLGMSRLDQRSNFLLSRGRGLSGGQTNLQWAKVQSVQEQSNQRVTDIGFVAQQDFNWQDRLSLSLGARLDKSSLNVDANQLYFFPKVAVAANIANFDFWTLKGVSQFKLRAAYGETGGLPNFGVTYESLTSQLIGGGLGGQVSTRGVDPNLVPETAAELEFGVDLGFLNNRVTLEATYYNKNVNNLILDLTPAEATGITAIATNAADLVNRGFELGLGLNPVRTQNFNWFARLLYWRNVSEITRLDIPTRTTGGFGPSLGTFLIAEGFSPTTIVGNPSGQTDIPGGFTVYGDRQPDFQMSWFNQITLLKNIDFTFLFHYQQGGSAINLSALLWDDGGTTPNWDGDDDNNGTPNGLQRLLGWAVDGNTGVYINKTDYLKLRELGLYYTLPKGIFGQYVERVKVGVSANNLLLWTNFDGYDPEVSNFGSQPISSNVDVTPYPGSRRFFFHLKLDF